MPNKRVREAATYVGLSNLLSTSIAVLAVVRRTQRWDEPLFILLQNWMPGLRPSNA